LIGMRVRPNSTVSCTGMSRIMLMSLLGMLPGVGEKLVKLAGATCSRDRLDFLGDFGALGFGECCGPFGRHRVLFFVAGGIR